MCYLYTVTYTAYTYGTHVSLCLLITSWLTLQYVPNHSAPINTTTSRSHALHYVCNSSYLELHPLSVKSPYMMFAWNIHSHILLSELFMFSFIHIFASYSTKESTKMIDLWISQNSAYQSYNSGYAPSHEPPAKTIRQYVYHENPTSILLKFLISLHLQCGYISCMQYSTDCQLIQFCINLRKARVYNEPF